MAAVHSRLQVRAPMDETGYVTTFFRSEFKANHAEWVNTVKRNLGPGIRERIQEAVASADDSAMEGLHAVRTEFKSALAALLQVSKPTHPFKRTHLYALRLNQVCTNL